jgi:hypothetical protein
LIAAATAVSEAAASDAAHFATICSSGDPGLIRTPPVCRTTFVGFVNRSDRDGSARSRSPDSDSPKA